MYQSVETPQILPSFSLIAEPKYDGHRLLVTVDPISGTARAVTRTGHDVSRHVRHITRTLVAAYRRMKTTRAIAFDGELMSANGPNVVTSVINGSPGSRDRNLSYVVYDLPVNHGTYSLRRKALLELLGRCRNKRISIAESVQITSLSALRSYYRQCLGAGHEGIVIKIDAIIGMPGAWLRVKPGIELGLGI